MQNGHILFVDTSQGAVGVLALVSDKEVKRKAFRVNNNLSEQLLTQIFKLLRKITKISSLGGIVVVRGPGSYTGVRVGVATANALSYASELPILGIKKEQIPQNFKLLLDLKFKNSFVKPFYIAPPNTTAPNKQKKFGKT